MEHPNAALVRRLFSEYADFKMVEEVFSKDAVWIEPGISPISGQHVGHREIHTLMVDIMTLSNGTFSIVEVSDVLTSDRIGLAVIQVEGTHDLRHILTTDRVVFAFEAGRICELRVLSEDQVLVDGFWA